VPPWKERGKKKREGCVTSSRRHCLKAPTAMKRRAEREPTNRATRHQRCLITHPPTGRGRRRRKKRKKKVKKMTTARL
jgi:hypothetical protein